jgi:hypothetical protein
MIRASLISVLMLAPASAMAQYKNPGEGPWTGPRTADGQPDIRGTYDTSAVSGSFSLENPMAGGGRFPFLAEGKPLPKNPSRVVVPSNGLVPYRPDAKARRDALEARAEDPRAPFHIDTQMRCLLQGPARGFYTTQARFVQIPGHVLVLYNQYQYYRIIRLNTPPLGPDVKLWMGDSVGRWEGNTLVVNVGNVNAKARLSMIGDYYGPNTKITERITFVDRDTIQYSATFEDPSLYTQPWTLSVPMKRDAQTDNEEFWEYGCHEGEKTSTHLDDSLKQ